MINRILGWVFTLAVLATVVFAALNWGGYTSMCFDGNAAAESSDTTEATTETTDVIVEGNENEEPAAEPLNIEDVEDESTETQDATESTL
jgi:hypothetical protein